MAENPNAVALPSIAALPPTTARQIGSGQVLVDPSSVVKELIDNALDARARSIFVEITANTIDSVQVKDDSHGIPAEDRSLVCRRYCTSKIRDFQDLRDVGGKWLGFRGEALSSLAEMSGTLHVATRVEGEPVAVKLKYGRNGELVSSEHDSHPVGTTVKVTKFFEHIPVRKQTAIKNSVKSVAKIRRLMQAYALARPTIRFRLRILKLNSNKGDFVYAPKADANVEDAVLKVIGKDCTLQCDWTAMEADGFEIHAFLPKPTAIESKIANQGVFVSIDARPVTSTRGTAKQVVAVFKDRLRKSNPSLARVKDPFFCMNIICPPDSYDPNIEPAKDDVMFENSELVLGVVNKLLLSYYPEAVANTEDDEPPRSVQQSYGPQYEGSPVLNHHPLPAHDSEPAGPSKEPAFETIQEQPRWRSSMYGIDEDDLEFLQENQAPVVEEEEEEERRRAVDVSNPWTIARMNATVKSKQSIGNGQLISPAKSQNHSTPFPSSPVPAITPGRTSFAEPLTPQTSSRANMARSPLDDELEQSIRRLPLMSPEGDVYGEDSEQWLTRRDCDGFTVPSSGSGTLNYFVQADLQRPGSRHAQSSQTNPMFHEMSPPAPSAARRGQRKQHSYTNKPFAPPTQKPGAQRSQSPRLHKHVKNIEVPLFPSDVPSRPRRHALVAADHLMDNRLYAENKTDIRDFFERNGRPQHDTDRSPSLTPINPQSQSNQTRSFSCSQQNASIRGSSRASSAEPQPLSKYVRNQLLLNSNHGTSTEPCNMTEQFGAYTEREGPPRPSSTGSQTSLLFNSRPSDVSNTLPMYRLGKPTQNAKEMEAYFQSHQSSNNTISTSLPRRQEPRTTPPHESTSKPRRLRRRRTTDGGGADLERTKSSKLPLERTPQGFRIVHIVLHVRTSLRDIVQSSRKLNMARNTPAWGYAAEDAYKDGVFAEPVSERGIMAWVVSMDDMLHALYERVGGVEIRGGLHAGVQRGLDARKEVGGGGVQRGVDGPASSAVDDETVGQLENQVIHVVSRHDVSVNDTSTAHGHVVMQQLVSKTVDDDDLDFDMSPFVDLDAGDVQKMGSGDESAAKEYDEDIEDDMLLDL